MDGVLTMGWGAGRLTGWNPRTKGIETRMVGYTMLVFCDVPRCLEVIDRGLGYRCGEAPEDVQRPIDTIPARGCGAYTCAKHSGGDGHDCLAIAGWREDDEGHITCVEGHAADEDDVEELNGLDWGDPEPACRDCDFDFAIGVGRG